MLPDRRFPLGLQYRFSVPWKARPSEFFRHNSFNATLYDLRGRIAEMIQQLDYLLWYSQDAGLNEPESILQILGDLPTGEIERKSGIWEEQKSKLYAAARKMLATADDRELVQNKAEFVTVLQAFCDSTRVLNEDFTSKVLLALGRIVSGEQTKAGLNAAARNGATRWDPTELGPRVAAPQDALTPRRVCANLRQKQTRTRRSPMLRAEDNKFLTESGAGTGMGDLLRRFWIPVLLSEELPEADGTPKKIVVMGEELLAFRDSRGVVGVIDQYCPHRGANLWLGRNEECGIRCVYHGWKFDTDGRCVDMPTSYPDLNAKDLIRIKSYPVREWGDMIWAYMGPAEQVPELPDLEMALVPASHRYVSKKWQDCNWVQALEGSIDTAHFTFAHLSFRKGRERNPRHQEALS
jgi:nitrite reductase/ring-hydroxylating ferredoxin subunit